MLSYTVYSCGIKEGYSGNFATVGEAWQHGTDLMSSDKIGPAWILKALEDGKVRNLTSDEWEIIEDILYAEEAHSGGAIK